MSKTPKTKVAIVGCGRIAAAHLQALQTVDEVGLVGVADVDAVARDSFSAKASSAAYSDYREMIDTEKPEIVVVCVPPISHPEVTIYALQHGANVLCEKPFAIDTRSALRMVEVAEHNNRYLTMASKFRFVEDVAKAREMVLHGLIGRIVLCEIAFCARADMGGRWPSNPKISGGGVLIDNGSHAVDIIRYLLGPIRRVQGQHGRNVQGLSVEDTTMVFVETVDGVWGRIDLSWSIEKNHNAFICMHGSEGMIVIGWNASRYRRYDTKEWTQFGGGYNKLTAFVQQHRNFIDCVHGKANPIINAEDSLESVRVIEVAYKSAHDNKWMEVEECVAR